MGIFNTEIKTKIKELEDLKEEYRVAASDEEARMEAGMAAGKMQNIIFQIQTKKFSTLFLSSDEKKILAECTEIVRKFEEDHKLTPSV